MELLYGAKRIVEMTIMTAGSFLAVGGNSISLSSNLIVNLRNCV